MNISIITGAFLPEKVGVSLHLYTIVRRFSELGHRVLLLCPDYSLEREVYPQWEQYVGPIFKNVFVRYVPSERNPLRASCVKFSDFSKWRLEEVSGDFHPDIIQVDDADRIYGLALFGMADTMSYNACIGIDYGQKHSIPVIAYYHTNFPAFCDQIIPAEVLTPYRKDRKGIYQKVFAPYNLVLCSSEETKKYLNEHGLFNVRNGIFVGYNEEVFDSAEQCRSVENNDQVKLLYAGRFDGGKDIRTVIELFRQMHESNPDIQLYLAGEGGENAMEFVLSACEQNQSIKYLGKLSQEELAKVYNSVDIYFSPQESDTLGISIVEAMAKGLPIVAANQGGPVSLVTNNYNGFLCNTEEEYVERTLQLCEDQELRKKFASHSLAIAEKYRSHRCAANLLDVYAELIERVKNRQKVCWKNL